MSHLTSEPPPAPPAALLDDPQEWDAFGRPVGGAGAGADAVWESQVVLEGMHCAACALTIEEALRAMPGVDRADVSAAAHRARVVWRPAQVLPSQWMAAVRHAGIVRSDAAQRLSLFIPLLAAFLLFGEPPSARKLVATLLAAGALTCLLRRAGPVQGPANAAADPDHGRAAWLWPLAVWLGYGVIDILFKQVARAGTAFAGGLLLAFVIAGLLMLAYLLLRRVRCQARHLAAGVVLGLANFGNILTYIRAHQSLPEHPALVFASMNMGVITLGTLVGALAFREPLSRLNLLGIALALGAIVLMAPW